MDTASDKYKPYYGNRAGPFLAVWRTVRGLVGRLVGFFMLTESDRLKAGIYISSERLGNGTASVYSNSQLM